ncbi:hypothetical protein DSAG12_01546 [Promethearchaeum syntrophicum]|uniref:Uncharacterized protein n=1 Tax=Promethearchaeum syntrophicum TaxID=2594042 RepID=A0A5B9D978_9ARCH|nr:hypothetical protein [Candidatus Prometheoarchaeum syntrophicum]QEE15719.1 hypothetical protein DSAG12_01546 [Candidatus Prometheoarchaeum syntrophicum]
MDSKKITTNRGITLILLILVIITSIVFINFLIANNNFDNERLTSRRFSGSLTIENQPVISMEIYFDGFGLINGTMNFSNDTLTYEGDYICRREDVQFSFMAEEIGYFFAFMGTLHTDDTILTGDVRFYKSANENYTGTFNLLLI